MRIDAESSLKVGIFFIFCLLAKFYFHTQICRNLEAFQLSPTLSSLVAQPQKNRENLSIFLFSHFQPWLLHNILRFLIILKYQISLNRGFRVHPFLVMDGTLWPQHQGIKSDLFNLIPLLDNFEFHTSRWPKYLAMEHVLLFIYKRGIHAV